jgi:hypothetical protein
MTNPLDSEKDKMLFQQPATTGISYYGSNAEGMGHAWMR